MILKRLHSCLLSICRLVYEFHALTNSSLFLAFSFSVCITQIILVYFFHLIRNFKQDSLCVLYYISGDMVLAIDDMYILINFFQSLYQSRSEMYIPKNAFQLKKRWLWGWKVVKILHLTFVIKDLQFTDRLSQIKYIHIILNLLLKAGVWHSTLCVENVRIIKQRMCKKLQETLSE